MPCNTLEEALALGEGEKEDEDAEENTDDDDEEEEEEKKEKGAAVIGDGWTAFISGLSFIAYGTGKVPRTGASIFC